MRGGGRQVKVAGSRARATSGSTSKHSLTGRARSRCASQDLAGCRRAGVAGGESTTIAPSCSSSRVSSLRLPSARRGNAGSGHLCGMILLAAEVLDGRPDQRTFRRHDLTVGANASVANSTRSRPISRSRAWRGGVSRGLHPRPLRRAVGGGVEVLAVSTRIGALPVGPHRGVVVPPRAGR